MTSKTKKKQTYVVIRTYSAGVFAGYLVKRKGKECELINARRIWYWKGAASLSQLANEGVKCPLECKFAQPVHVELTEVIEVLYATEAARNNIEAVPVWQQ